MMDPAAARLSDARLDGESVAILDGDAGGDSTAPRKSSRTSCDARRRISACAADASSNRASTVARTMLKRSKKSDTSDANLFLA